MPEFKYTLTRFCLRTGQLSLPHRMLERLPAAGDVQVMDAERNEVFAARFEPPRTLSGMGDFFERHQLAVNDTLLIETDGSGSLLVTPKPRSRRVERGTARGENRGALDKLLEDATPLSAAEIEALHPNLGKSAEVSKLLIADPRFTLKEGRWQPASAPAQALAAERLASSGGSQDEDAPTVGEVLDEGAARARGSRNNNRRSRASVTPYPRGVIFPGDTALNSAQDAGDISQQQRVKNLLGRIGYRVEGLAHGQLLARADLVRRQHSVLLHLLPDHGQLDWAALLARRREAGATYLAVFGHDLDLAQQESPAEMAKASLWAWNALARLEQLLEAVPLSPVDLESHFEDDGLYGKGLERFEASVEARVEERGVFSSVLTRLAGMRAPAVFLLDDVVDPAVSREQVLKVLELLGQAPFHLISKVDSGEFCLRVKVADGLARFSDYAMSLRERLPSRRTERLQGEAAEPEAARTAD